MSDFAKGGRRIGARRWPLRKIVSRDDGMETLECGHQQYRRSDIYGVTCPVRRRCRQCGRAQLAPAEESCPIGPGGMELDDWQMGGKDR